MGNRAVVTFAPKSEVEKYYDEEKGGINVKGFTKEHPNLVGVYLHWNGGNDSVVPFCKACKKIGFRCPTEDFSYGVARFVQLVANFFGGCNSTSIGVDIIDHLDCDNWDNGIFIIGEDWEVVGREFAHGDDKLDDESVARFVKYLVDIQMGVDDVKEELNKKGE